MFSFFRRAVRRDWRQVLTTSSLLHRAILLEESITLLLQLRLRELRVGEGRRGRGPDCDGSQPMIDYQKIDRSLMVMRSKDVTGVREYSGY